MEERENNEKKVNLHQIRPIPHARTTQKKRESRDESDNAVKARLQSLKSTTFSYFFILFWQRLNIPRTKWYEINTKLLKLRLYYL